MEAYDTLVEAIDALRKQGYTDDYNLLVDCLECKRTGLKLGHDAFHIDKFFRFEGDTNPDDSSIIYAISAVEYPSKGILVNSYGVYAETLSNDLLRKLH